MLYVQSDTVFTITDKSENSVVLSEFDFWGDAKSLEDNPVWKIIIQWGEIWNM